MFELEPLFDPSLFNGEPIIISGPCSAESEQQVLDTARQLSAAGVKIFRAGIWKPRKTPSARLPSGMASGIPKC